ncbi:hypothetical protein GUITHDRAFT_148822 [Guillardia theta CCMP2712]|uniref:PH domain-containing protein n=1 Tax=Guillardia theta (strain CCMP2712) TaxID=905079 RepID=L1I7B8_GUITC|nr:hypothetical protein GUITHDRAFT_148822 [Guillardia theta CCMP2712]EKX32156.1 hypothetical protein GUITHDRAFT_148822 [Guillardia theta CCMP2712]|eukprot:XP_005819136.1 hypothetical protein GUITHDRAFT_148822 [Guillardia theta CCMP2712]
MAAVIIALRRQGAQQVVTDEVEYETAEELEKTVIRKGNVDKMTYLGRQPDWRKSYLSLFADRLSIGKGKDVNKASENIFLDDIEDVIRFESDGVLGIRYNTEKAPTSKRKSFRSMFDDTPKSQPDISGHNQQVESMKTFHCFEIVTTLRGRLVGRKYLFRAESREEADEWEQAIKAAGAKHGQIAKGMKGSSLLERLRYRARKLHASDTMQKVSGLIVVASFILSAVEVQLNVDPSSHAAHLMDTLEMCFTYLFAAELALALFAYWFWDFWKSAWNVFDLIIVSVSLVAMFVDGIPVFVTCIYAILAVHLFADAEGGAGPFGTFLSAMFTMFQVCTGDAWASSIARGINPNDSGQSSLLPPLITKIICRLAAAFFTSYMLIAGIVLMNIVVAVLLDEFLNCMCKIREEERAKQAYSRASEVDFHPLDSLLDVLAMNRSAEELQDSINTLFLSLDSDLSGSITFQELVDGLNKLNLKKGVLLTQDDWEGLIGDEIRSHEAIDSVKFHGIMMEQLRMHLLRRLHKACVTGDRRDESLLLCLKWIVAELAHNKSSSVQHLQEKMEERFSSLSDKMERILDKLQGGEEDEDSKRARGASRASTVKVAPSLQEEAEGASAQASSGESTTLSSCESEEAANGHAASAFAAQPRLVHPNLRAGKPLHGYYHPALPPRPPASPPASSHHSPPDSPPPSPPRVPSASLPALSSPLAPPMNVNRATQPEENPPTLVSVTGRANKDGKATSGAGEHGGDLQTPSRSSDRAAEAKRTEEKVEAAEDPWRRRMTEAALLRSMKVAEALQPQRNGREEEGNGREGTRSEALSLSHPVTKWFELPQEEEEVKLSSNGARLHSSSVQPGMKELVQRVNGMDGAAAVSPSRSHPLLELLGLNSRNGSFSLVNGSNEERREGLSPVAAQMRRELLMSGGMDGGWGGKEDRGMNGQLQEEGGARSESVMMFSRRTKR